LHIVEPRLFLMAWSRSKIPAGPPEGWLCEPSSSLPPVGVYARSPRGRWSLILRITSAPLPSPRPGPTIQRCRCETAPSAGRKREMRRSREMPAMSSAAIAWPSPLSVLFYC
jgi:hypothetical protein